MRMTVKEMIETSVVLALSLEGLRPKRAIWPRDRRTGIRTLALLAKTPKNDTFGGLGCLGPQGPTRPDERASGKRVGKGGLEWIGMVWDEMRLEDEMR